MGLSFYGDPAWTDEILDPPVDPPALAKNIAERKMADVAARVPEGLWVLGADTFNRFPSGATWANPRQGRCGADAIASLPETRTR
jgi:predicted house-cleaning NTP pyrophosphatase (Maf/HAM1 superfamily)